jgi:ABC-2 type transport system ATP-binding protein
MDDARELVVRERIADGVVAAARERSLQPADTTEGGADPRRLPRAVARIRRGAVIETRDLRRTFRSRKTEVEAVRGVDLRVEAGQIFGFLGPNGAGKTTTLRMLATLLPPSAGEATVAGADLLREPEKVLERIGYVPQGGSTDAAETGRRALVLPGRLSGMSRADAQRRAADVLAALDLEAAADRTTGTYSGGMRRRLDIGLGIVHRPQILFLDEPTTGLDPQARARMWDEIRRLQADGTTVFLTTHYLEEADALADRLAIIDRGRLLALGSPAELRMRASAPRVEIIGRNFSEQALALLRARVEVRAASTRPDGLLLELRETTRVAPLIALIVEEGGEIEEVRKPAASLEEVYLSVMGAPA